MSVLHNKTHPPAGNDLQPSTQSK